MPESQPYAVGYDQETMSFFACRRASTHARFFLPHLKPGMRLLDCGSGTGSLTIDLAAAVTPAEAIGVDIEASQIAHATERASRAGVTNVRFQTGSALALPFPDETFDAVFSHGVIEHLAEPVRALREIRRVLKEGGVLGVRHADFGGFLLEPAPSPLDRFTGLFIELLRHNGGDPHAGRHQPRWLLDAGFSRFHLSASYDCWTETAESRIANAHFLSSLTSRSAFAKQILQASLADKATLEALGEAFLRWGKLPEAFAAEAWTEAVAWK